MSEATETASAIPKWPVSILDTDLYKARPPCPPTSRDSIPADSGVREQLTMQNAVFKYYPEAEVSYRYTNRNGDTQKLSRRCCDNIRKMIDDLEGCVLTDAEYDWLEKTCPYFDKAYLDYLRSFRFSPQSQVHLRFTPSPAPTSLHPSSAASTSGPSSSSSEEWGDLEIVIEGKWSATILYEVPILAILSESYFSLVDTTWDYRGQVALAESKGLYLFQAGCAVTDFGTRRRRSYHAQDLVLRGLGSASRTSQKENFPGKLSGTSNVHFAMKYGLAPVGTIAHEMIMATAAMEGYEGSNGKVLDMWEDLYKGQLTIALTDTFSTKPFWEDYCSDPARANRWKGLRQDSGDPATFAKTAKSRWISLGIDPKSKVIVFSDGLNPEKCVELQRFCDQEGIGCSFGVGTNLTNDFKVVANPDKNDLSGQGEPRKEGKKSKALNIVIKLATINGRPCVKISDELTKNTGDPETVRMVKRRFGLQVGMGPEPPADVEETPSGSPIW